jgi:hypothetical protein
LEERRSEGWIRPKAGNVGNTSVSHRIISRVVKFRSQISIIKLPPGIHPQHRSSHCSTECGISSPQSTVCGHIFWQLTFLPFRCHRCHPVSGCQTETPPLPSPRATRRAGNSTTDSSSRYWLGHLLRCEENPMQFRIDLWLNCARGRRV